jgi:hypothetical protein
MMTNLNEPVHENEERDDLKLDLLDQAAFRRRTALKYPEDDRNIKAAVLLEQLAASVVHVPSPVMTRYAEVLDSSIAADEAFAIMLRAVGFRWEGPDATAFLRDYIACHRLIHGRQASPLA